MRVVGRSETGTPGGPLRFGRTALDGPPSVPHLGGMLRTSVPLLVTTVILLAMPAAAHARQPSSHAPSVASLSVRVLAADSTGVPDAEVAVGRDEATQVTTRSDEAGDARFPEVPVGMQWLSVRRVGLAPQRVRVRIAAGGNRYTVRLQAAALSLVGLRVVGDMPFSARLDDFERRRLAGTPSAVVTREQIDRLGPITLSRVLRGMAGLRIGDSLGNVVAISTRGAKPTLTAGRNQFALVQCVMQLAVDGVLLPPFANLDQIVPREVHGVEVYFGPARLPPELAGLRTDNWCGVVAVWTRGG